MRELHVGGIPMRGCLVGRLLVGRRLPGELPGQGRTLGPRLRLSCARSGPARLGRPGLAGLGAGPRRGNPFGLGPRGLSPLGLRLFPSVVRMFPSGNCRGVPPDGRPRRDGPAGPAPGEFLTQVGDLLLQGRDLHVPFGHRLRDGLQRLISDAHVVAPRGRRRPQQRDVGRGDGAELKGRVVGVLGGQLATATGRYDDNAGQDDDRNHQHEYGHDMNRAMPGTGSGN